MAKRKEIKFQDRHGALRGRQNGMEFWIRKDELQTKGGKQRYFVTVYPASNDPQQISTGGRQDFDLAGAMEFCQKIAAGEIKLEDLQAAYDAEDDAKERAVFREITEKAKKFHARLDAMGLKYRDLLELEVLAHGLGDMSCWGMSAGRGGQVGPENSGGPIVVYIDGQPVEIAHPLPEITPDYSAGGTSAEDAAAAMATVSKAWADICISMEVAAEGIGKIFRAAELASAVWLARIFQPEMAHRYLHTKKKRTRKKYEKRIMAWFREVFR